MGENKLRDRYDFLDYRKRYIGENPLELFFFPDLEIHGSNRWGCGALQGRMMGLREEAAVCLDIGGTFIKSGLITTHGDLLCFNKQNTRKNGAAGLIEQAMKIIAELLDAAGELSDTAGECRIAGIGISSAGQVNHNQGNILFATDNLPGWTGIHIKGLVEERFHLACCVDNDVNCAALGEMYFGNARNFSDFVCITIGTGIGGAIVKDSKLIHGYIGSAGEVGHMIIKAGGLKCNCGNRGCYEQYASASAFRRRVVEKLEIVDLPPDHEVEWLIHHYPTNRTIKKIINDYVGYVAIGIINLLHMFNPAAVIIGGFASQHDFLIQKISESIYRNAMPEFTRELKILPARLDNKASLFGVSTYIFKENQT